MNNREDYLSGQAKPNYRLPAIRLEVIPVMFDDECIAIDIVNTNGDGPWPVVYSFDLY